MGDRPATATRGPVPQHRTQRFDLDSVVFTSDFDSGNLGRVEKAAPEVYHVWTAPDCAETAAEATCRSWFYFQVTAPKGVMLTIVVKNLNLQGKMFREGHRPVYCGADSVWNRVTGLITYQAAGEDLSLFEVTFRHHFTEECVSFAFSYPWSYEQNQVFLSHLVSSVSSDIYIHRENLIPSLEGRRCDLLTISSYDNITDQCEFHPAPLFPEASRPYRFQDCKKVAFVTARVHPGETPGSLMLNGFLKWVCSADPRAVEARKHFVFKVIPMLNPDGVFRGYYRTDTMGLNLNRFYQTPDVNAAPTIWATRAVVMAELQRLYFYVDLHGHAAKRGIFLYGNYLDFPKQVEAFTFAKLMAANCANFDFEGSNFTERNMKAKDKRDGLSKEGSGRVALYRATGLALCFTMEANYHSGAVTNTLAESGLQEPVEARTDSKLYESGPPVYTVEILEDAGKAIGISLLDSIDKNPYSRVPKSEYASLQGVQVAAAEFTATLVPFRFNSEIKKLLKNRDQLLAFLSNVPIPKKKQEKAPEKRKSETKAKPPPRPPPRPRTDKVELIRDSSKTRTESPAIVNVKIRNFVMPKPISPRSEARRGVGSPAARGNWKPGSKPRRTTNSTHNRKESNSSRSASQVIREVRRRHMPISFETEQIIEVPAE